MKKGIILAVVFTLALPLSAQIETPRISQHATVSQTIGTTDIEIVYHRPGVKGRVIWGGLVPYDEPWRMGANEATTIELSDEVMIEGRKVPAGKYSMFAIPGRDGWTIVINENPNQWGAYGYEPEKDVVRVEIEPVPSPHTEWMRFTIDPKSPTTAEINLEWEGIRIPIDVEVDVDSMVWAAIDQTLASSYVSAASWALESGKRLDDGLRWVDESIAMSGEGISNLWTKARLLHRLERNDEALRVIDKAIAMAEGNVPGDFMDVLQGTRQAIVDDM